MSDENAVTQIVKDVTYPIVLGQGSQLILRRDTSYRFGDGSNAGSAEPIVLVICE